MKTRIPVETTLNQEVVIGLIETGELRKATQAEVRSYFEAYLGRELDRLDETADELTSMTKATPKTETNIEA